MLSHGRNALFRVMARSRPLSLQSRKPAAQRCTTSGASSRAGALSHIRVLDLSRVLAGPWATQFLADMGADVIKVEMPNVGDDTRGWGPPFLADCRPPTSANASSTQSSPTGSLGCTGENEVVQSTNPSAKAANAKESAYFLGTNRGKRSITVDIANAEGQKLLKTLVAECDVFIENFKVGGLAKYGLDYKTLLTINPRLVYASISGYGQDGPRAHQAGYDFAIQAMGGLMSITGERGENTTPMKVGVAVTDIMTGMYTVSGILTALIHREKTGEGQYIDTSLFDTQLAYLANQGMNFLVGGKSPTRLGNQHPNIVPYSTFPTKSGQYIVVTVGNDGQYRALCQLLGVPHLAEDPRFATNANRVANRTELYELLNAEFVKESRDFWLSLLNRSSIPHSPVNSIGEAFEDPQAKHRGSVVTMNHPVNPDLKVIANPLRMSATPVQYDIPPPLLGQHTEEILSELLHLNPEQINDLKRRNVV